MKWCPTQHAFPRSAIFTDIVSIAVARSFWLFSFGDEDLFREIPDMVCDRFSLDNISFYICMNKVIAYAVFS